MLVGAQALMTKIFWEVKFDPEATTVSTPVMEVLEKKRGVCQDFAHLMIACLRACGLAARYVSGYLVTRPPPGRPRLAGADASHAWVSVYAPGFGNGWVDFDPTNTLLPDSEHITVAIGRDFGDISPLRGIILGLTSNRILVIELKNWAGDIEFANGQWIQKGTPKSRR